MTDETAIDLGPAELTMKPLLGRIVQQAVLLGLADVCMVYEDIPVRDLNAEHRVVAPIAGAWREAGPATIVQAAEEFGGVELRDPPDHGSPEDLRRDVRGVVSMLFDGDDRFRWFAKFDAVARIERFPTAAEREQWHYDPYSIPDGQSFDPVALAQCVACRLLGTGGWALPNPRGGAPIYTGNATPRDIFEATFVRPDQDAIAELAFDLRPVQETDDEQDVQP